MKDKKGLDRRKCNRFEVLGAEVMFKKAGLFGWLSGFSKTCNLLNLSKGGVGFLTDAILKPGQKVFIVFLVPSAPPLTLRGRISWQASFEFDRTVRTGVEFMPFGSNRGWNSRNVLEVLNRLEQTHGEKESSSNMKSNINREIEEHIF